MSLTADFDDMKEEFLLLFFEDPYSPDYCVIKSSKSKEAILYLGHYFNHKRNNQVFKCRHIDASTRKKCTSTFTLMDKWQKFKVKEHIPPRAPMEPIECDIMIIMNEIP